MASYGIESVRQAKTSESQTSSTLAPPRRKVPPGVRAHSTDSARVARKSIIEAPSIHVVDGWAYAAVPTTLKYPSGGSKAASASTSDLFRTQSNNSDIQGANGIQTLPRSQLPRQHYQQHSKAHSESSTLTLAQFTTKSPAPLHILPKKSHTTPEITTIVSSMPSEDTQERTLELSQKIHRVRPRTDSRRPLALTKHAKSNSEPKLKSDPNPASQICIQIDIESVVTSLSGELREKALVVAAAAAAARERAELESESPEPTLEDRWAASQHEETVKRSESRLGSRPLPAIPTHSPALTDSSKTSTSESSQDQLNMSIERQFLQAVTANANACADKLSHDAAGKLERRALRQTKSTPNPKRLSGSGVKNLKSRPRMHSSRNTTPSPSHSERMKKLQILRKRLGEDVPTNLVFPDGRERHYRSNSGSESEASVKSALGKAPVSGEDDVRGRTETRRGNSNKSLDLGRRGVDGWAERRFGRADLDLGGFDFNTNFGLSEASRSPKSDASRSPKLPSATGVPSSGSQSNSGSKGSGAKKGKHLKVYNWLETTASQHYGNEEYDAHLKQNPSIQDRQRTVAEPTRSASLAVPPFLSVPSASASASASPSTSSASSPYCLHPSSSSSPSSSPESTPNTSRAEDDLFSRASCSSSRLSFVMLSDSDLDDEKERERSLHARVRGPGYHSLGRANSLSPKMGYVFNGKVSEDDTNGRGMRHEGSRELGREWSSQPERSGVEANSPLSSSSSNSRVTMKYVFSRMRLLSHHRRGHRFL